MLTWRIHILIPYLPQSSTNKNRHICTWPCKSVRLSCTCSLRDCLWCNRRATVLYTLCMLQGVTTHNVSLPSICALVCNDCHLVMRSDIQTRSQQTQQHWCPLYGLELNYTYWLHQLRGPSRDCLPPCVNKGLVLPCP